MRYRTIVTGTVLLSCGVLFPAWAGEEKPGTSEHVLKMVEEIAGGKGRMEMPSDAWAKESNRLQLRVQQATREVKVLEILLAKKKAEAQSAEADARLFAITHTPAPAPK